MLDSPPGDAVGGGQDWDLTYTASDALNVYISEGLYSSLPAYITLTATMPGDQNYLLMNFSTDRLGIPLTDGFYPNAQRAAFADAGHPGEDIAFNHLGYNTLTGYFTITSVDFHALGSGWFVDDFSASFNIQGDGDPHPLTGSITYSSTPEPTTIAALALGVILLAKRRRVV